METSIIIRTKNEEKWLGTVLKMLARQTHQDFEIIIVDSGSTDKTLEIVKKFPTKLIKIAQEEFSYPHALNVGCENAIAQKYFLFLSAHSLPISKKFIETGIKSFINDKVIGVYGPLRTLPDASIWEKLYYDACGGFFDFFTPQRIIMRKDRMGVLGFTNAIIRRDLWEKRKFDEAYGMGGEDQDWVKYWTGKGYVAVKDKKFNVKHSHGLKLSAFILQWQHWASVVSPQPYKRSSFRD